MTRTTQRHLRVYADGYDLSGFARSIGPFGLTRDEVDLTAWTDTCKGYLPGQMSASLGTFNAVLDNTATTGIHALLNAAGGYRTALVAIGFNAAPVQGDPVFAGQFLQSAYQTADDGGALTVTIQFSGWASNAATLRYGAGFGQLLHAAGAATAANTSAGIDNYTAAATTTGGFFVYQVLAGNGTATLSVDDSADNSSWSALSGATSGSINCATPQAGIVALTPGATVRRYLRWQMSLGTATTVTFVSAFVRG